MTGQDKSNPCHGCDERTPTCHGVCTEYLEARDIKQQNAKHVRALNIASIESGSGWSYDWRGKQRK